MAKELSGVTLTAPSSDPNVTETQTFQMSATYTVAGHGGEETVDLHWRYSTTSGSGYVDIPTTGGVMNVTTNPEAKTDSTITHSVTVTVNTAGTYYLNVRAVGQSSAGDFNNGNQVLTVSAGATTYEVDLAAGSYSLSGQTLDIDTTRPVDLAAGSYSLSGNTLEILPAVNVDLAAGSYTLSGQALDVGLTYSVDLALGSYALAGQSLDVDATYNVDLASGAYTLAGQSLDIVPGIGVDLAAGIFTLAGQSLDVDVTYNVDLGLGDYTLSGIALDIDVTHPVDLGAGSYVVSGNGLGVDATRPVDLSAGGYTKAGLDLDILVSGGATVYDVDLASGSYALSGNTIEISVPQARTRQGGGWYPTIYVDEKGRPVDLNKKVEQAVKQAPRKRKPAVKEAAKRVIRDLKRSERPFEITEHAKRDIEIISRELARIDAMAAAELVAIQAREIETQAQDDLLAVLLLAS